ncbi:MAG: hypothetical protein F6K42_06665 [Leptolyngbya sp. SIO1D8]|nr:hypothetical protein [Leptolyngbya sp. SIO1D8]
MTYQTKLRPWCIVHQLPEMQRVIVERFRRYQDADAHLQVLQKLSPKNSFVVMFDPDAKMSLEVAHQA